MLLRRQEDKNRMQGSVSALTDAGPTPFFRSPTSPSYSEAPVR